MELEHINGMGSFAFPSFFLYLPLTTKSVDKRFSRHNYAIRMMPIADVLTLMIEFIILTNNFHRKLGKRYILLLLVNSSPALFTPSHSSMVLVFHY